MVTSLNIRKLTTRDVFCIHALRYYSECNKIFYILVDHNIKA